MHLTSYKVTNFRSVADSGWIDINDVTALIGVNESGKTNLLLPLWKLNPAREGAIEPTSDYPKTLFGSIRQEPSQYPFITAEFECKEEAHEITKLVNFPVSALNCVHVTRYYDGQHKTYFPNVKLKRSKPSNELRTEIQKYIEKINAIDELKQEKSIKQNILGVLSKMICQTPSDQELHAEKLNKILNSLSSTVTKDAAKTSVLVPTFEQLLQSIREDIDIMCSPNPGENSDIIALVVSKIPRFVYYSNYGNLDSEIYLPHVVDNLQREDLGEKESAKARTLRVLFKFVQLEPEEILELGKDFPHEQGKQKAPSDEQISTIAEAKRTRSILLQSAGTTLTKKFRDWWQQGDYRFRFEADGNHFRIWVSDDRRPQEVELENRSSGLQWFLSFYLIFLVESEGVHSEAILLLDEPGLSLHPLAQRDLSAFFDGLSATHQLIYTSHSPFLVDADRIERARKVFVARDGTTKATSNLRHSEGSDTQAGAAYAVHSALNLSVAESLLVGCHPIIVEGASDQLYLTAIKDLLIGEGHISPKRELVFPPSGGTKTARAVASILTGRDERLPMVLLDGDEPGRRMARDLTNSLYAENKENVIVISDFLGLENAEIEDLLPGKFLADEIDRMERRPEVRLSDVIKSHTPFVPQVEAWAAEQRIEIDRHWKVHLAKRAKQTALLRGIGEFDQSTVDGWVELFEKMMTG